MALRFDILVFKDSLLLSRFVRTLNDLWTLLCFLLLLQNHRYLVSKATLSGIKIEVGGAMSSPARSLNISHVGTSLQVSALRFEQLQKKASLLGSYLGWSNTCSDAFKLT